MEVTEGRRRALKIESGEQKEKRKKYEARKSGFGVSFVRNMGRGKNHAGAHVRHSYVDTLTYCSGITKGQCR